MAHVEKFTFKDACHIFSHNDRSHRSNHYSNEEIDPTRTIQNVYFTQPNHAKAKLLEFLNDNSIKKYNHKELKVCASWIVTLPQQVKKEDQKKFFNACYEFLRAETMCEELDTTLNAVVHNDETSSHLHFCFCPLDLLPETKAYDFNIKEACLDHRLLNKTQRAYQRYDYFSERYLIQKKYSKFLMSFFNIDNEFQAILDSDEYLDYLTK